MEDDLLAYARLLGLIEGFDRDAAAGTVTIHLWACSVPMSDDDAFGFLADCIHEALLRMNRAPRPLHPPGRTGSDGLHWR